MITPEKQTWAADGTSIADASENQLKTAGIEGASHRQKLGVVGSNLGVKIEETVF